MLNRKCFVCGGIEQNNIGKLMLRIPIEWKIPSQYDIVSCEICGTCFADTSAAEEDYDDYYVNCNTYSGTVADKAQWNWLHNTGWEMLSKVVLPEDSVCDMGFGRGEFLEWMREQGHKNICGIDPSPDSVENAKARGFNAECGSVYDESCLELGSIKAVVLFDVMEHLLYPEKALNNIKSLLANKGGYVLISVPNYSDLGQNNTPITNMINQEHINYFSIASLDNLMMNNGFSRVDKAVVTGEVVALCENTGVIPEKLEKDIETSISIRDYVEKNQMLADRVNAKLKVDDFDTLKKPVYVWGTGAFTMWLMANTDLKDNDVTYVDNNPLKIGKTFLGDNVISPKQIDDENRVIVICSMLYSDAIRKQIMDMGLKNPTISLCE